MQFQKKSFIRAFPQKKRGGIGAVVLIVLAGIGLVAACYYASTLKGSKDLENDYYADIIDGDKAAEYLRESESLDSKFNSIHEFKKNAITTEDIDIYDKAITCYEKYLMYSGIDKRVNPRADKMRRKLHNLRADKIRANTTILEGEAEKLAAENKYAEAEKLFSEAVAQEQRINVQFALAEKKNHARTIRLQNRVLAMQAIPLAAKANALEEDGRKALELRNWARASLKFREALKAQQLLWTDYRNVVSTGTNRIANLNTLIETASSALDFEEEQRLANLAKDAEKKGDYKGAEKYWKDAFERHTLLCKNFPRSEFASEKQTKEFELAVANAGARPQFEELKKIITELQEKIRSRKTEGVPILARRATVSATRILDNYPTTSLVSESLLATLRYLDVKSHDIGSIQKAFIGSLATIPGVPAEKSQMMNKEVSQAFYTFVIGENPSANTKLPLAPVESVDYLETQNFCRRLGMLIGFEVRLPSAEEFKAAMGNPTETELAKTSWALENSGGVIHVTGTLPANANGFFDIYGNVGEWVLHQKDAEKSEGCVMGGDCQFPLTMLLNESTQKALISERSRLRGFRVVIDWTKPVQLLAE